MFQYKKRSQVVIILLLSAFMLSGCQTPADIAFAVKHLRDQPGKQITEVVSYVDKPGLDNSSATAPLQVEIRFERAYNYQINERLNTTELSAKRVKEKIVELYHLPPNNPEDTEQTALCPVSIVIPPGMKAIITVEWTERWAEGVINEGTGGQGDRLGTYSVFLGYIEPCSLVKQENTD